MFQTMINEILQDLINTGEVVSFIDDIIVRMKEEKGHDEVVEKVVKRLKQKVRKIRFLKVVIELEGIKIEEEKMKEILDQPTSKRVKNIQKFLGLANYY